MIERKDGKGGRSGREFWVLEAEPPRLITYVELLTLI